MTTTEIGVTTRGNGVFDIPIRTSVDVVHLMDITVRFQPMQIFSTPVTNRLIAAASGGTFDGPRLRGEILPGGGDWLVLGTDNIARLDVRATLRTEDGDYIYLTNTGRVVLTGQDTIERYLAGETLRSADIHARTAPLFETGADSHAWLNGTVNISFVDLSTSHIAYRVYTVA